MSGTIAHSSHFYRSWFVIASLRRPCRCLPPLLYNQEKREISHLRSLRGTRSYARSRMHCGSHDSGHDCRSLCARSSHDPGREAIATRRCAFGSVFPIRRSNILQHFCRNCTNTSNLLLSLSHCYSGKSSFC